MIEKEIRLDLNETTIYVHTLWNVSTVNTKIDSVYPAENKDQTFQKEKPIFAFYFMRRRIR